MQNKVAVPQEIQDKPTPSALLELLVAISSLRFEFRLNFWCCWAPRLELPMIIVRKSQEDAIQLIRGNPKLSPLQDKLEVLPPKFQRKIIELVHEVNRMGRDNHGGTQKERVRRVSEDLKAWYLEQ